MKEKAAASEDLMTRFLRDEKRLLAGTTPIIVEDSVVPTTPRGVILQPSPQGGLTTPPATARASSSQLEDAQPHTLQPTVEIVYKPYAGEFGDDDSGSSRDGLESAIDPDADREVTGAADGEVTAAAHGESEEATLVDRPMLPAAGGETTAPANGQEQATRSQKCSGKSMPKKSQQEQYRLFKEAAEGNFSCHSYVGNWWRRELDRNKELNVEYRAAKRPKDKQELKKQRIKQQMDELKATFVEEEGVTEEVWKFLWSCLWNLLWNLLSTLEGR